MPNLAISSAIISCDTLRRWFRQVHEEKDKDYHPGEGCELLFRVAVTHSVMLQSQIVLYNIKRI